VDVLGSDSAVADAETILVAVDLLRELGLRSDQVRVKISHRETARHILAKLGVPEAKMLEAFDLLDRREKLTEQEYVNEAQALGLTEGVVQRLEQICRMRYSAGGGIESIKKSLGDAADLSGLQALDDQLKAFGIHDWCEYDLGIVRGLAYYTGTVFEIHEATGVERAMAGGGRYDQLIELFGGPSTPAVGFGMGDVVLSQVLADKGLIPEHVLPRPDVYVLAGSDAGAERLPATVTGLRQAGCHTRFSYKTTRNVGKLLKEAGQAKARFALILDDQVEEGTCSLKNLETGEQTDGLDLATVADHLPG
jgi:histidyl-tRNA synthetase